MADRIAIRKIRLGCAIAIGLSSLFAAVTQATEEAVDNALIAAKTMIGPNYWVVPALPHDQLQEILRNHNVLRP
jgi:hypothetical protein